MIPLRHVFYGRNNTDAREQARFTSKFAYTPLPSDTPSIRLLSIKPGSGSEILECSLRVAYLLHEAPTYTALSYSWTKDTPWSKKFYENLCSVILENLRARIQDPLRIRMRKDAREQTAENVPEQKYQDATEIIFCDGKVMKVTPSLYDALLQLRQRPPQEYWIDALCINQMDDEEKSSQVQMMGRIYREAELVLVWLGTLPPGFSRRDEDIDSILARLVSALSRDADKGNSVADLRFFTQGFLALCHLLSRRYFQRAWVVQEIALSKKVIFLLGEHYLGTETFLKVVGFTRSPFITRTGEVFQQIMLMRLLAPQWMVQFASMPLSHPSQPAETDRTGTWSLHDWLETCIGRKTGNDKDLAFAGLSLIRPDLLLIRQNLQLSEACRPPLPPRPPVQSGPISPGVQAAAQVHQSAPQGSGDVELWPRLKVDYSTSRHEVLVNLAACVLSGPDPTALLSISSRYRARNMAACSCGYNPILAPSWVPALAPWSMGQHKIKSLGDYGVASCAATQVQNDFRISSDGSTLLLSATRLGSVQRTLVPPRFGSWVPPVENIADNNTLHLIREIYTLSTSYHDKDRSYLAKFASASTWGFHERDHPASQDAILGFCLALEEDVNDVMDACNKKIQESTQLSDENREIVQQQSEKVKRELSEAYEALKQVYPDVLWPKSGTRSIYTQDTRSPALYFSSSNVESIWQQRLFTTDTGYIGHTKTGAQSGDQVVLVHGASVPYIFRRVDDAIRAEIEALRSEISSHMPHNIDIQKLQKSIKDLEGQFGKRDGWIVVGEAYVEGVMNGEAGGECFNRVERFSLV